MVITQLVTVEQRVLTGSLHTVPNVHRFYTVHQLEWMAQSLKSYSEKVVREFYVSYVVTLRGSFNRRAKLAKHDSFTQVLVRGCRVDISPTSVRHSL